MPSAERRSNGTWRARWYDRGVRKSEDGFLTKTAAEDYAADREAELRAGRRPDSTMTWGQWQAVWMSGRVIEMGTRKTDSQNIEKHLKPRWADVALCDITQWDIREWVAQLEAAGMAPGTVAKVAHVLSGSLSAAVDKRLLAATPYTRIRLPEAPPGTEFYFEPEQIDRALAELLQPYRLAVLILVFTGMRFGEMAGLHWQRVDRVNKTIEVVETWSSEAKAIKPYPKSRRMRSVPLLPQLEAELPPTPPGRSCGLPHLGHGAMCRSPLVCPAPEGGALDARNMRRRHWYPALEAAGLTRARQHDLRHTFASWLRQKGVSLDDIGEVLGHADVRTVQRYAHVGAAHLDRVRTAMQPAKPKKGKKDKTKLRVV